MLVGILPGRSGWALLPAGPATRLARVAPARLLASRLKRLEFAPQDPLLLFVTEAQQLCPLVRSNSIIDSPCVVLTEECGGWRGALLSSPSFPRKIAEK